MKKNVDDGKNIQVVEKYIVKKIQRYWEKKYRYCKNVDVVK